MNDYLKKIIHIRLLIHYLPVEKKMLSFKFN